MRGGGGGFGGGAPPPRGGGGAAPHAGGRPPPTGRWGGGGAPATAPVIRRIAEQEQQHLETFNDLIGKRRARPTALLPIWHLAGFALGAGTALLGKRAAMACTVAVEEVIEEHYAGQIEQLDAGEEELKEICETFRRHETEHRDIGLEHGARQAPGYQLLTTAVKTGSRLAIWLSERI